MSQPSNPVAAADAIAAGAIGAAGAIAAGADRYRHGSWVIGGGVHYSIHK